MEKVITTNATLICEPTVLRQTIAMSGKHHFELANSAYRLSIEPAGRQIQVVLHDRAADFNLADGAYLYQAAQLNAEGELLFKGLEEMQIKPAGDKIILSGKLAGLELEHCLHLPRDNNWLEESIRLCNNTGTTISLSDFSCGMRRPLTNEVGHILPGLKNDRFQAIPFLHRPTDPADFDNDFDAAYLLDHTGRELVIYRDQAPLPGGQGYIPANKYVSEGWCWRHSDHAFGIFKYSQETMEFSVLSIDLLPAGVFLRFGGNCCVAGEPGILFSIDPGQRVQLGTTRYTTCQGGYEKVAYAFRHFMGENGCRFPSEFNPPVHWNELYDNPEWSLESPGKPVGSRLTRQKTYTRELILEEAVKAIDYHCEALYLDPGWDTDFATFLWGEAWLGNRREFIRDLWENFGLRLSLHAPLATWLSYDGRSVSQWPQDCQRKDVDGNIIPGSLCLGSKQYLEEAEKRLLENCADGVGFLMFDGNWYNGGCWNLSHGHPVPYTKEAHCRANLDLAQRIHAQYPDVLIEMHDMITGGSDTRYTPVYYKYGLAGSFNENWGFELMWSPLEDIRSGRARALYYYNLACNIPLYLHIDLRDDNQNCLAFWWYASTCRHLGIGGTHDDLIIADAQKTSMKRYRKLEAYFKRGDFYGLSEEVHLHVLPSENAFVVNLFNLSDDSRMIGSTVRIAELGLDPDHWYCNTKGGSFDPDTGCFTIMRRLEPWSAQVAEVAALE